MPRSLAFAALRFRTGVLAALALCAAVDPAHAQSAEPDFEQWVAVVAEGNLDGLASGLRLQLEIQTRRMNAPLRYGTPAGTLENPNTTLLVRPSVSYQFRPWGAVAIGYGFTPSFYDDGAVTDIHEHRIWEQFVGTLARPRFVFSSRTRLEQRIRTLGPGTGQWAHRLREMARVQVTLAQGEPWLLVVFDEIMFNFDDSDYRTESGFDQNRAFAGFGYQARPNARFELGYLHQFVNRIAQPNQSNHVLLVNVYARFGDPSPTRTASTPDGPATTLSR